MKRTLALVCFAAVAIAAAPKSARAQKARVLVLVKEQVDGGSAGSRGAEPVLVERLVKDGYQVVERYEAKGVRSRIPLERLVEGKVSGNEVSAINADVLVVGLVELDEESLPYGIKGKAYDGSLSLRVILVDNARVVYSGRESAKGKGSASDVSAKVAGRIADDVVKAVGEAGSGGEVIELRVDGLKEAEDADDIAEALGKLNRVKSAKVRYVSADVTVIDVLAPGMKARALAGKLGGLGLSVSRRSTNQIAASYDALAAARRSILVAALSNRTGNKGLDWIAGVGRELIETELVNSKYLTPKSAGEQAPSKKRAALRAAKRAGANVVAGGYVRAAGQKLLLTLKAIRVRDGRTLASVQAVTSDAEAPEAMKELAWKLDQALYKKLNKKSSLAKYETKVRSYAPSSARQSGAREGGRVLIAGTDLQPIFPAQLGRYADEPFGTVTVKNAGDRAARGVRLGVKVEDLTGGEQRISVGRLRPGEKRTIPLAAVFDREKLIAVTQRRPVRVELKVYESGGDPDGITASTVLHDRNAMNWKDDDAIASFVTHRDPFVKKLAEEAIEHAKSARGLPKGLAGAVALLDTIQALQVRYRRDPIAAYGEQAVDAVMFPRQTVERRAGDCDDLSVLYASLLAASGRGVKLVYTPGHVFVAVDTEVSSRRADDFGGKERIVEFGGRAWIPVEVTRLDGGFAAAWDAGVKEIGRYSDGSGKVRYVDVGKAWNRYPPFPVTGRAKTPRVPAAVAKRVKRDARAVLAAAGGNGVKRGGEAGALLRRGVRAAREGEHERAIRTLKKAAASDEVAAAAWNNIGNVHILEERYGKAIRAYGRALRHRKIRRKVLTNKGFALYKAGRGRSARKTLRRAGTAEAKELIAKLGLKRRGNRGGRGGRGGRGDRADRGGGGGGDDVDLDYGMRAGERLDPLQVLIWLE